MKATRNAEPKNEYMDIKEVLMVMNPTFQISQCPEVFNFEKFVESRWARLTNRNLIAVRQ